jgi:hypothetical protein
MSRKPGVFTGADQARDAAIRSAIGRTLRAQYDLEPLPERFAGLVERLADESRRSMQLPFAHGVGGRGPEEEPASP